MSRALILGDVVGRPGRRALEQCLPKLREQYCPDFILVNGENAAGGFGLTRKIYHWMIDELKISAITMGNHWHDKKEFIPFALEAPKLVLPANMENVQDENLGLKIIKLNSETSVAVINLIGQVFMKGVNRSPFQAVSRLIGQIPQHVKIKIVDMHAEASSEKQAMGHFLTGRVSLVYGTHSHVPAADERVFAGKTGFITDIGATAAYDSVIGMDKASALERLLTGQKSDWSQLNLILGYAQFMLNFVTSLANAVV